MQLPRHFVARWLEAFERSRVDNHRMVTEFIARLERTVDEAQPGIGQTRAADYRMGGGWRSSPDARKSWWDTLKLVWQERAYLRRVWPHLAVGSPWVVADDRRTGLLNGWADLAQQVRAFGSPHPPAALLRQAGEPESLVFFSPNLLALRPAGSAAPGAWLSYLSLFATPLAAPAAFLAALLRIVAMQPLASWRHRNTWVTVLLAAALWTLLAQRRPGRLLMITSNSFVIELLRYLHAASGAGHGVTEVLHGIPTCEIEAYHQQMLGHYPQALGGRLHFIPPVPGLRLEGYPPGSQLPGVGVNLKMNAVGRTRDLRALADLCVARAGDRRGAWVVALNGAGTVEGRRYLNTGCFALERAILHHVAECGRHQGIALHLQYSLHPAHLKSGEAGEIADALSPLKVEVLQDSLQTWLESDLCISIFSSASWDAHALGCQVAIGIGTDDQIYSRSLLAPFAHPTPGRSIFDVLGDCLKALPGTARLGPHARLQRLWPGEAAS